MNLEGVSIDLVVLLTFHQAVRVVDVTGFSIKKKMLFPMKIELVSGEV